MNTTYKYSVWQVMVEINTNHIEPVSKLFTTRELARQECIDLAEDFKGYDLFVKEHKVYGGSNE